MRPARDRTLPLDESLEPTHTPLGATTGEQSKAMRELRQLHNDVAAAYVARDERLYALAISGLLTRRDMATACGMNKSRVDQILAQMSERIGARRRER